MKFRTHNAFLVLSSMMLLTGCMKPTAFKTRVVRYNLEDNDAFSIITDLEETKEIHTDRQKEYLSYDGDYVSIPEANYPDGQQHLSDPLAVNLEWDFDVPSDKTLSRYDVIVGKEADLSDGYALKGTTATNLDVYNSYLGENYFKVVANYTDGTTDSSPINMYTVDDVYPRNLKIDGMTNCRDMGGGRVLENGGRIKQGLLFRTSSTNSWAYGRGAVPDTITTGGKEELLKRLGCKTEINVNNSGSNQVGVENYVQAYMYYDGGKHHLYRNAEPLKEVFHALSDIDNYPIFYHCRIGTDRTGLCAIMISGLLGVSENEIYQDYLFSNFGNIQEKRYIGEKAGRDNILNYINDIKAFPGEKFHNKVYNYLLSIGVPAEELDSVIDILTEGDPVEGNNHYQTVITPDLFTSETLEPKTSSNHAHPKEYYTLTEGDTISANFEAPYYGEAKLVAYLGSTDSSKDKKISESIEVEYDYEILEQDEVTFYDAGFGTGDNRTYYSAVVLGTVDVYAGYSEINITGLANNLNIGLIAIIPGEDIDVDEPEEPVQPEEPIASSEPVISSEEPVVSSEEPSSEPEVSSEQSEIAPQPSSTQPEEPSSSVASEQASSTQESSAPASSAPAVDTPAASSERNTARRGCGGSIIASTSLVSLVAMAGVAVLFAKKRKER